jgi:putative endonuclease
MGEDTSTSNRFSSERHTGERPGPPGRHNQRLGAAGEELTAVWYRRQGYRVVARNWRTRNGELDLILARQGELVVCEVKTRSSRRYGHPLEAVTPEKRARIRRLAMAYVAETKARGRLRFDIAAVESGRVEVWEGVF